MLTQDRLKELLSYDADTGDFRWIAHSDKKSRILIGAIAGSVTGSGYINIKIDQVHYMAHRLAFLYVNGQFPVHQVDHIDGVRRNNKFSNLRDVPMSVNMQNKKRAHKNNTSGFLGVVRNGPRFQARIGRLHLGTFATPEEAHAVYLREKRIRHAGCTI